MDCYTIIELSRNLTIPIRTLHYFDETGLLKPSHTTSKGQQLYSKDDILRLIHIILLQYMGFTIEEMMPIVKNTVDVKAALMAQTNMMVENTKKIKRAVKLKIDLLNPDTYSMKEIQKEINKEHQNHKEITIPYEPANKNIITEITILFDDQLKLELSHFDALPNKIKIKEWLLFWAEHYEKIRLFTSVLAQIEAFLSIAPPFPITTYQSALRYSKERLEELHNLRRTKKEQQDLINNFKNTPQFHLLSKKYDKIKEHLD